jgi:hypothetical protein
MAMQSVWRCRRAWASRKFSYFFLLGLGILLGLNAAGLDLTALNVLTGAIGIGLGFGLQAIASELRQRLRAADGQVDQARRRHQLHRAPPAPAPRTSAGCRSCAAATWSCAIATASRRWCRTST